MSSPVRVRFAPSPTGYLHVGGARTALFNWLYARHTGGTFVLRIEDTDLERSTQAATEQIIDAMKWLGLDYDEGPFYQAQRVDRHKEVIAELEAKGVLYRSYLTTEELDAKRAEVIARKQAFCFKRAHYDLPAEESARRAAAGVPFVLRLDVGLEGAVAWNDQIRGHTSIGCAETEDFVVSRSSGAPTYNFVCAVDDADMRITHVIRGEDHIPNTPKQILVLRAMGVPVPDYAHLSLILGNDKAPLSKRHGATSVQQFREEGFLPDALVNFLALLGWSFDDKTEVFSREELVKHFSLDRVNKAGAVFDMDKLRHMNGLYIRTQPRAATRAAAKEHLAKLGLLDAPIYRARGDAWLEQIIGLEIERSRTINDFGENLRYFFEAPKSYEEKAAQKLFLTADAPRVLVGTRKAILELEELTSDTLDKALRARAEELELGFGKVAQPVRLALTGRSASPGLYDVIIALGREECAARLNAALQWIHAARGRTETENTQG